MTARADGSHLILLLDLATQHPIDLDLVVRMLPPGSSYKVHRLTDYGALQSPTGTPDDWTSVRAAIADLAAAAAKQRPSDPNVFFERCLMVCWLLSCTAGIESQKPGVINWFRTAGCSDFVANKYVPDPEKSKRSDFTEGTATTPLITQELTSAIATDVDYFGHTYPFIEVIEDDLLFDPSKTREFDFTMAQGHMEINCKTADKKHPIPTVEITDFFHTFNRYGMPTD